MRHRTRKIDWVAMAAEALAAGVVVGGVVIALLIPVARAGMYLP